MAKKFGIVLITALFILDLFALPNIYAAPVGNIAKSAMLKSAMISPDKEKAPFGIIGEGEFDLTVDRGTEGDENNTEVYFAMQKVGVIFADRLILYGLIGGAWFEEEFRDQGSRVDLTTERDLGWGFGTTLILYEKEFEKFGNPIVRFGLDAKYRRSKANLKKVQIANTEYKLPDNSVTSKDFDYKDWQIAGELSVQLRNFIPYFGVKYSDLDAATEITVAGPPEVTYKSGDLEARENFGAFVGMDLIVLDYISYTIEYRFIDERALTLSGTVRF